MKYTQQVMGMPLTIICPDETITTSDLEPILSFLHEIDDRYSPYKKTSLVAAINENLLLSDRYSDELQAILNIADHTKKQTNGFFDVWHLGVFDPSGIVKGWAIQIASDILSKKTHNFYLEIAGDIQVSGHSETGNNWRIGVRNPFNRNENISIVSLYDKAIATSGTAVNGNHIYNPHATSPPSEDNTIVSLSVIGNHIVDADRFATGAFAMGRESINFIESLEGFEGYMVDTHRMTTQTSGWKKYEVSP